MSMIRVAELMGAQLDYFAGLADGIPAEHLRIQEVQRSGQLICVQRGILTYDPSTSWMTGGALFGRLLGQGYGIFKNLADPGHLSTYTCYAQGLGKKPPAYGDTPLIAVCRVLVLHTFGEEVEEIEVTR